MSSDVISVQDAARILGVTAATVLNWQRLGKLSGCTELKKSEVISLRKSIEGTQLLKERRNKSGRRKNLTCIKNCADKELNKLLGGKFTAGEIRAVLCEAALRIFSPGENRLDAFIASSVSLGEGDTLIRDLIRGAKITCKVRQITNEKWSVDTSGDALGDIYNSLLPLDRRRALGAYYTPDWVAEKAIEKFDCGGNILDPACGSGSFLLAAAKKGLNPTELFAMDIDPAAVCLARLNLFLRYPQYGIDYLYKNIKVKSFFKETGKYSAVMGNPPWGGKPEKSGEFLLHALELLEEGGKISLVLPQSLLSSKCHAQIRERLLSCARLTSVDYIGDCFQGVFCPSVILAANKSIAGGTEGCIVNSQFTIRTQRGGDLRSLNLNVTDREYRLLEQMRTLPNAMFLKNNARFALGIVTGDNRRLLTSQYENGSRPVIRGTDVSPFCISEPKAYMIFDKAALQQCAPEEMYDAKEKIVYRFIGSRPIFAVDRLGRLTLNSCNIIIPQTDELEIDYITAVLNSSAVEFFLKKSFDTSKWLRWHLEEIPIPRIPLELQRKISLSPNWNEKISELYFGR